MSINTGVELNLLAKEYQENKSDIAFGKIMKCTNGKLNMFISRFVKTYDDIEELKMLTYTRVWQNIYKYDPNQYFINWLYSIARNECLNYIRDNKKVVLISNLSKNDEEDKTNTMETLLYNNVNSIFADELYSNTKDNYEEMLFELDKVTKEYVLENIKQNMSSYYCFYLYYYKENTSLAISKQINVSEDTVKTWLRKCKQEINNYIKENHKHLYEYFKEYDIL